jgi:hypothetical protein
MLCSKAPSTKVQRNSKHQNALTPCLELEVWCFSGAWSLELS